MRAKIIAAGVKHLREFGYPDCTVANILTDDIYRWFFKRMVEGTLEDAPPGDPIHRECTKLLAELNVPASTALNMTRGE